MSESRRSASRSRLVDWRDEDIDAPPFNGSRYPADCYGTCNPKAFVIGIFIIECLPQRTSRSGNATRRMSNYCPHDPFKKARQESGVLRADMDGENIPLILRHQDLRDATRDINTFTSDTPCRVPIPSEEGV